MVSSKVNMAEEGSPIFSTYSTTGSFQLSTFKKYYHDVTLRFNQIMIYDDYMGLGSSSSATKVNFIDTQYSEQGPVMIGSNDI